MELGVGVGGKGVLVFVGVGGKGVLVFVGVGGTGVLVFVGVGGKGVLVFVGVGGKGVLVLVGVGGGGVAVTVGVPVGVGGTPSGPVCPKTTVELRSSAEMTICAMCLSISPPIRCFILKLNRSIRGSLRKSMLPLVHGHPMIRFY